MLDECLVFIWIKPVYQKTEYSIVHAGELGEYVTTMTQYEVKETISGRGICGIEVGVG